MTRIRVELPEGLAEGLCEDGVRRFYSLPYAAPMTSDRRFRAPQPPLPWEGVRDATTPGPRAPQAASAPIEERLEVEALMGAPTAEGPDYLTLNVFAPEAPQAPCPVMVFIHGGSFVAGGKDAAIYDGTAFGRDGVVCVVINYRLGIEGFLPLADAPTNLGLRDMIAALAWVRDRIALFGGDPGAVTLFGESGGAYCTAALITSPLANTLFHRAICQSGHALVSRPLEVMQRLTRRVARRLRVSPDRAGILSAGIPRMLAAQAAVLRPSLLHDMRDDEGRDPSFGITKFLPVHGDDVLPLPCLEALAQGAGAHIDLLIGATSEEAALFFAPRGVQDRLGRLAAIWFMSRALPDARAALRAYGLDRKGEKPGRVLSRAMTDLMFRHMARRTAERHRGRAWVYEFDWRSPALEGDLGAAHAMELPFVFDTLAAASGERGLTGPAPPQELADFVHRLWIGFARTGEAPWPAWDAGSREVFSLTRRTAQHEPVMPAAAFLP
ncbi:MAG TPA: carboxylesterase family protein [Caulobacteraceae bacterium]|nr:carboxylesterase family protein [Caulobacteraceae bacterium]